LKSIYLNGELPESLKAKAASAAIAHEVPKLLPERQLELKPEEPERSLEEIYQQRLKRQNEIEKLPLVAQTDPETGVMRLAHRLPKPNGGNGATTRTIEKPRGAATYRWLNG